MCLGYLVWGGGKWVGEWGKRRSQEAAECGSRSQLISEAQRAFRSECCRAPGTPTAGPQVCCSSRTTPRHRPRWPAPPRGLQAQLSPSGWSRSRLEVTERKASRERCEGAHQDVIPHAGRCVIRREVPPKPVALLGLQRHQFAYQDTSNSLHGVHPGALAPLPAITLPSCPHSSRSRLLQKAPGFLGALYKPSST